VDWTEADIGDQTGRLVLVTGANSGIGWHTARALAQNGAEIVLGCRNPVKADEAADRLRSEAPDATVSVLELDLADLDSVAAAAKEFRSGHSRLDLLINNAGLVSSEREETTQGHELMFGVNHLGHFALTAALVDLVVGTDGSRVVNVASNAHKFGKMDFDDLHFARGRKFRPWGAYGQSKLANLLFTLELQRRFADAGVGTIATSAHPGWAKTNIGSEAATGLVAKIVERVRPVVERIAAQDSQMGALPTLRAAVDPAAAGGAYYGPAKESKGPPVVVSAKDHALDTVAAERLWEVSVELTGSEWPPF
jgi:NAD(P)-dependent dehydrogenase (short-subunit alcohol dehydrogenase family)